MLPRASGRIGQFFLGIQGSVRIIQKVCPENLKIAVYTLKKYPDIPEIVFR